MNKALILMTSMMVGLTVAGCSVERHPSTTNGQTVHHQLNQIQLNLTMKNQSQDVREAVWAQLPADIKDMIKGRWQSATVTKKIVDSRTCRINDSSYIGKEAYAIDFPDTSLGPQTDIVVLADIRTYAYIGGCLVD